MCVCVYSCVCMCMCVRVCMYVSGWGCVTAVSVYDIEMSGQ